MNGITILRNHTELATRDHWTQAIADWLLNFNSPQTSATYERALNQFSQFAGNGMVTQSTVIAFKTYLGTKENPETNERPDSDSTINLKLSALSSFFKFVVERGLMSANPVDGVKRLSVKPYGKATYLNAADNQDMRLLEQPDTATLIGKRDYAILLLLLTTGVRVSALVNATVADVKKHATGYILYYTNKGGATESAQLLPFVHEALKVYLKARSSAGKHAPLFETIETNRTGKQVKPLTRNAITAMISRYAKAAGLHHVTAHSLRHTAAMVAAKQGTVAQVKAFLRHKSARTTAIYLDHVADSDVSEITKAVGSRYS